jgi:hypothetical protein
VPAPEDGDPLDCGLEVWPPPALGATETGPVGYAGLEVWPAGTIGVVTVMVGDPGHMVQIFSVVVKPEGQPVGRV